MLAPETAVKTTYCLGEELTVRELLAGRDRGRSRRRGHPRPPTRLRRSWLTSNSRSRAGAPRAGLAHPLRC